MMNVNETRILCTLRDHWLFNCQRSKEMTDNLVSYINRSSSSSSLGFSSSIASGWHDGLISVSRCFEERERQSIGDKAFSPSLRRTDLHKQSSNVSFDHHSIVFVEQQFFSTGVWINRLIRRERMNESMFLLLRSLNRCWTCSFSNHRWWSTDWERQASIDKHFLFTLFIVWSASGLASSAALTVALSKNIDKSTSTFKQGKA